MTDPDNFADAEWQHDYLAADHDTYDGPDIAAEIEAHAYEQAAEDRRRRAAWARKAGAL